MRLNLAAALLLASAAISAQTPVRLDVDATDATRRLFHVKLTLPAKAGPMTLLYPQWIPGEHGPTGPIVNLVGLKVQGGGNTISWRRDDENMYAFHLDVPGGVSALEVAFDYVAPAESSGYSSAASTTSELAVLNWNQLLLYPQGIDEDTAQVQATLRVPKGWRYGTALPIARESGDTIEFQPAPVTTLVDSPLSTGAHYRTIDLGADMGLPHFLHIAADSERALAVKPEIVDHYRKLVKETGAIFGARHYRGYHFLFTLSDHIAHFGLEHHESSDDRYAERTLIDSDPLRAFADLLPHEFVHSWNGKYRRPAGLTANGKDGGYRTPMKGGLLWVYEGLTQYLGEVLTRRCGLWSDQDYREWLAVTAAELDTQAGRRWRPLEDTAVAAQILYSAGSDYNSYRRNVDYYPEGTLIWLEADTIIRQMSRGRKSLDDFCRAFHGGSSGRPELKTYELSDVVAALNSVQPYDWAGFFQQRLLSTAAHAPLGGIERGGWKLAYDDIPSEFWKSLESDRKVTNLMYSIGLNVSEDGTINDVQFGGPAQKAGIPPSTKLIAVNGRAFTPTVLREAVSQTASDSKTLEILIRTGEYFETHRVEYRGGERFPHLVRDDAKPDLLSEILKPKSK